MTLLDLRVRTTDLLRQRDQNAHTGPTFMPHSWWRSRAQRDHTYFACGERITCFKVVPHYLRAGIGRGQRIGRCSCICISLDDYGVREYRAYAAGLAIDMHASGAGCPGRHTAFLAERINPVECIDRGACVPVFPVEAI